MANVSPVSALTYRGELLRKALHLLALSIPVGMLQVSRSTALAVLWPLALVALGADLLRARWPAFHQLIRQVFGSMMRPEELPPPGGPIAINGATWVLLSSALLATLFPLPVAATAFAVFMVGDAAAAIVGRRFGRHYWPGSHRTFEGSLAFFGTALLTAWFFPVPMGHGILAALLATILEVLPLPLNDNVRVPLAVALLLWLLQGL
ncbi:diacylglycerol/polyprenol kinase family protein [Rhodothermus profundi]|uniref:Dolichol kinase n=1 Tax=Rhodothermus profundi TaxID=633813 RepID=A0A1M6P7F9_9BACT|nr:phosphatidate cytidylyltransferase [Rhodothermus profundi]SHK03810.1 Dolichol kinase [Rhodothermus profundi]